MADQYRMSAVILCGGKSRRMGTDKAMLTREGTPNAVRLLNALSGEDSPCTEVWLSIGTGESYPDIHAQKISDRYPGCGPMGGLEAALTVCREEYLFVTPVDTPAGSRHFWGFITRGFCPHLHRGLRTAGRRSCGCAIFCVSWMWSM